MSVTPQTNIDMQALAETCKSRDNYVICGHVSPDGDCLGSQLALGAALRQLGKTVVCILAEDEPADETFAFLPGFDSLISAYAFKGEDYTFVGVDVPSYVRVGETAADLCRSADFAITIDHHAADETMADVVYVDPDAASTTLLIWELAAELGVDRTGDIALCCYAGLVTDTGRFQFQNTSAAAFVAAGEMVHMGVDASFVSTKIFQNKSLASARLESLALQRMKLGAQGRYALSWICLADIDAVQGDKSDAQHLIDSLRSITGVRVACMLREQGGIVRGSFRAKDDTDVAALAGMFGGGGHKAAAGFNLECSLDEARVIIEDTLDGYFKGVSVTEIAARL